MYRYQPRFLYRTRFQAVRISQHSNHILFAKYMKNCLVKIVFLCGSILCRSISHSFSIVKNLPGSNPLIICSFFKYISHLVANHFLYSRFLCRYWYVNVRKSKHRSGCYRSGSVFTGKGTVQYGTFMLRSNNLQSRQVVSHDHYVFCRTFGKTLFDMT